MLPYPTAPRPSAPTLSSVLHSLRSTPSSNFQHYPHLTHHHSQSPPPLPRNTHPYSPLSQTSLYTLSSPSSSPISCPPVSTSLCRSQVCHPSSKNSFPPRETYSRCLSDLSPPTNNWTFGAHEYLQKDPELHRKTVSASRESMVPASDELSEWIDEESEIFDGGKLGASLRSLGGWNSAVSKRKSGRGLPNIRGSVLLIEPPSLRERLCISRRRKEKGKVKVKKGEAGVLVVDAERFGCSGRGEEVTYNRGRCEQDEYLIFSECEEVGRLRSMRGRWRDWRRLLGMKK